MRLQSDRTRRAASFTADMHVRETHRRGQGALVGASVLVVSALLFVVASLLAEPVSARATGIIDHSGNPDAGGGVNCTECHMPGADVPTVTIGAPDTVSAGETVIVTVTIAGGPGVEAGLNASVAGLVGELDVFDNDTRVEGDQITHTMPKTMDVNGATFTMFWTAPSEPGTTSIYAAGVSSNGNGTNAGDGVGTAVRSLEVVPPLVLGDVNCSGDRNIVDALFVAQYDAGIRTDGASCPLAEPTTQLLVDQGDLNEDGSTNIIDALFIAQCDAGIDNGFCD